MGYQGTQRTLPTKLIPLPPPQSPGLCPSRSERNRGHKPEPLQMVPWLPSLTRTTGLHCLECDLGPQSWPLPFPVALSVPRSGHLDDPLIQRSARKGQVDPWQVL